MGTSETIFPVAKPSNIFEVLDAWVALQPDALLYAFLDSEGEFIEQFTYRQFVERIEHLAAAFQQQFSDSGEAVLLAYQSGLEMIAALFACNKAGLIGIPTPPLSKSGFAHWQQRIQHLLADDDLQNIALCQHTQSLLTGLFTELSTPQFIEQFQLLNQLVTSDLPHFHSHLARKPVTHNSTFFIQYTSGSTSEPKGVEVTHANLLANAASVVDHPKPIAVSWLPQYHDMGLIGYYINILLSGGCTYGFAPAVFIRRPILWFETMSRYRATASSVPNFALELCLHERRIPRSALAKLDLSSLRFLMVAAEPVKPQTFFAFLDKFSRCGLPRQSLFVAYGLAEFTLAVSNYGRRELRLDTQALSQGKVQIATNDSQQSSTSLMSCGKALTDTTIQIINPGNARPVVADQVGEVWLRGPAKAKGYRNLPKLSAEVFQAALDQHHYLRSGDMGFLYDGELFICGRLKDMLIVNGRNIYPQDIEAALQENCPEIRANAAVAFQANPGNDIVVAAELRRINALPDTSSLLQQLRETLNIPLVKILLLPPKSIPRTSSGKVRRSKTREYYEQGKLTILASIDSATINELEHLKQRYGLRSDQAVVVFDAGLDSLDLVVLLHWLQDRLKTALSDQSADMTWVQRIDMRLFGIITIKQLFAFSDALDTAPEAAIRQATQWLEKAYWLREAEERIGMLADRQYSPADAVKEVSHSQISPAQQGILLTGATGFLGAFLLDSLLTQSDATLYILVRGESVEAAKRRLRHIIIHTLDSKAPIKAFDQRVSIVLGDLEQPLLGLEQRDWNRLSSRVDSIYHNAALVNYLLDYQRMRASNVEGTRRILDFAFCGRRKQLNYISTTFIFGWASKAVLYEQDQNEDMGYLDFGYSQSKWVAEQLVFSAMAQGLPARVFRPALITPALDGRGGDLDITTRLLAFMVKHGVAVETQNQVSFMPVDVTANNIVAIAQQTGTLGLTYHVTRDQHETLPQITKLIQEKTGIKFDYFDLKDFVPEVVKRCTPDDPLYPLLDFLVGSTDNIAAMEYKQYSSTNYQMMREQSSDGLVDEPLEKVVDGIILFLRKNDLMP